MNPLRLFRRTPPPEPPHHRPKLLTHEEVIALFEKAIEDADEQASANRKEAERVGKGWWGWFTFGE